MPNAKSKKNSATKLTIILDNDNDKKLDKKDEKYLASLTKRLKKSNREEITIKTESKGIKKEEIDPLKPKVIIHRKEEKKTIVIEKKETVEVEFKTVAEKEDLKIDDKDIFEVEKVTSTSPEFIEVKPTGIKKEETVEEPMIEFKEPEKLAEWEPVNINKDEIEIDPAKIEKEEAKKETRKNNENDFCQKCGEKVNNEFNFCPRCGNNYPEKEKEPIPVFMPVKNSEEKTEEIAKFEPVDIKEFSEEAEEQTIEKKPEEIEVFKDIKSIDKKTAVLLYNNGYKSIDSLNEKTVDDLTKIEGINKRKANKILKAIQKKNNINTLNSEKIDEKLILFEEVTPKEPIVEEAVKETTPKKETIDNQKKIDAFKELNSVNDEIAIILYDNGFKTVDSLKKATNKDLKKIKGVKRANIKQIKKELDDKLQQSVEPKPIAIDDTAEIELTEEQIKNNDEDFEKHKDLPTLVELKRKSAEWTPIDEESKEEPEEEVEITKEIEATEEHIEKEIKESLKQEKQDGIKVFKDIKSIDKKTAGLLFDNGYKSVEQLNFLTTKDLTKIKGIKRKKAKEIIDEIKEKSDWQDISNEENEEEIIDEKIRKELTKSKEIVEEEFIAEDIPEDVPQITVDKDPFKDIKSIDKKTTELLLKNGIKSIESLNRKTIKNLTKIRGIRKKLAQEIKKEVKKYLENREIDKKFERNKNPFINDIDDEDEWEDIDQEKIPEKYLKENQGYRHGDYTLYEKIINTKTDKKRVVRFFSKGEPEDSDPISLPKGYIVKENKKTKVPYLKKK